MNERMPDSHPSIKPPEQSELAGLPREGAKRDDLERMYEETRARALDSLIVAGTLNTDDYHALRREAGRKKEG